MLPAPHDRFTILTYCDHNVTCMIALPVVTLTYVAYMRALPFLLRWSDCYLHDIFTILCYCDLYCLCDSFTMLNWSDHSVTCMIALPFFVTVTIDLPTPSFSLNLLTSILHQCKECYFINIIEMHYILSCMYEMYSSYSFFKQGKTFQNKKKGHLK